MFEAPEYASYRYLCRELRLEREFEPGDWFLGGPDQEPFIRLAYPDAIQVGVRLVTRLTEAKATRLAVWLPRLDQWLAMLEEEGADCPEFDRDTTNGHYVLRRGMPDEWGHSQYGTGPTREEAAARLWMVVVGREVRA